LLARWGRIYRASCPSAVLGRLAAALAAAGVSAADVTAAGLLARCSGLASAAFLFL
jgi:hypothetical protein